MKKKTIKSDERKRLKSPLVSTPAKAGKEVVSIPMLSFLVRRGDFTQYSPHGTVIAGTIEQARTEVLRRWPMYLIEGRRPRRADERHKTLFIMGDPESESARTIEKNDAYWKNWKARFKEGLRKDRELVFRTTDQEAESLRKEEEMSKNKKNSGGTKTKSTKSDKVEKKADPAKSAAGEVKRQEWQGVGMCALIRYCGKKGFGKTKTGKIIEAVGLEPNPATITIQLKKGQKDDNVPTLSKEAKEEFNAIAADIPNDEKKAKKADKTAAKSDKKSTGKKVKKHKADDESDAEAQAEADAEGDDEEDEEEVEVEDDGDEDEEA